MSSISLRGFTVTYSWLHIWIYQAGVVRRLFETSGKKGKKQIVIGLIADGEGVPVGVEVFEGNRSDSTTVVGEVEKLGNRFGASQFTFVGDRGMLKKGQIDSLKDTHHYITAITKPQIRSLLKEGTFQMSLFDESVTEIESDGIRYITRRNPDMADEMKRNRSSKIDVVSQKITEANKYLISHVKAKGETQVKKISKVISKLS